MHILSFHAHAADLDQCERNARFDRPPDSARTCSIAFSGLACTCGRSRRGVQRYNLCAPGCPGFMAFCVWGVVGVHGRARPTRVEAQCEAGGCARDLGKRRRGAVVLDQLGEHDCRICTHNAHTHHSARSVRLARDLHEQPCAHLHMGGGSNTSLRIEPSKTKTEARPV